MEFKFPEEEELNILLKDVLEDEVDEKYYLSENAARRLINDGKGFRSKINPDVGSCLFSSMHKIARGMDIIAIPVLTPDRIKKRQNGRRFKTDGEVMFTLNTQDRHGILVMNNEKYFLRKLTPKECFRLMGFLDDEINLEGISNTQRYRLAGNGWDINLVSKILKEMKIPDNIETFEMFAGYGGGSFALKKLEKPFECVGYSEIDKFACQCYEQNHGKTKYISGDTSISSPKSYGDCREINPWSLEYFDLLMAGFPCQAFSIAGKGLGELDTRGTLFNEIIRVAEIKKPKYMLLENVKGLMSKKHKPTFDKILSELDRIGYDVFWKVCNTKKHGIPQNRDRIFFVCFRKDLNCSLNLNNTKGDME